MLVLLLQLQHSLGLFLGLTDLALDFLLFDLEQVDAVLDLLFIKSERLQSHVCLEPRRQLTVILRLAALGFGERGSCLVLWLIFHCDRARDNQLMGWLASLQLRQMLRLPKSFVVWVNDLNVLVRVNRD